MDKISEPGILNGRAHPDEKKSDMMFMVSHDFLHDSNVDNDDKDHCYDIDDNNGTRDDDNYGDVEADGENDDGDGYCNGDHYHRLCMTKINHFCRMTNWNRESRMAKSMQKGQIQEWRPR